MKTDMLGSHAVTFRGSVESVLENKRECYGGKDLWKRKVLSLGRRSAEEAVGSESDESVDEVSLVLL